MSGKMMSPQTPADLAASMKRYLCHMQTCAHHLQAFAYARHVRVLFDTRLGDHLPRRSLLIILLFLSKSQHPSMLSHPAAPSSSLLVPFFRRTPSASPVSFLPYSNGVCLYSRSSVQLSNFSRHTHASVQAVSSPCLSVDTSVHPIWLSSVSVFWHQCDLYNDFGLVGSFALSSG